MSAETIVHRLVDAFFTHCHECGEPRDSDCHPRSHWRLYLDLDAETVRRIRTWALDPAQPVGTDAERAVLLHWLETQEA
ncbi:MULTISPECIES: hypothetical protein [unclassified Streptomyces]|uniref:hypothetical protein n=1 Tax=Streptomycetaceae TaxID=2062 RepID=UPI002E7986ED|nr:MULTISPECIES: hypothetical protein [unclassified Streptomyces]MED7953681.1 hypothetical protein [Streptomyces sp. BE303]MEE1821373.1 hypothetical protein [Streptomyces sp. BE20]